MNIILLDRDGTLIADPPSERVLSVDDIKVLPHVMDALKILADNNYSVIIITNQAAIGEGGLSLDEFKAINDEVIRRLSESGVKILKTYMCPHSKEEGCECRKPKPRMILDAAAEYKFNVKDVFMIGDRPTDVQAGINAGSRTIQVMTATHRQDVGQAEYIAQNLSDAVNYVVTKASV